MVPQVVVEQSRGLEALPTRPPTPPREKQSELDSKHLRARHPLHARISLHTPPNYSPDSAGSTNPSSRRTRKKVEFTVQAEYREPPTYAHKENAHKQSTPASAPSSTGSSRPIRSILKPSTSLNPSNPLNPSAGNDDTNRHTSLATMLESTIKQLAGADRDCKVDAYTMLVRALKTSNNLPDRIALQDKMTLFMQFIQRDITMKGTNGTIDSSLVNHALTLLSTFLHFPGIASTLSADFGVFIIDHCIRSFEDRSIPKDVVRHLMQVVAFQDFAPKVMTTDRVGRLVASLHNIEEHLKGKSIIMSRIMIYRRLIKQSKMHMVAHSDWLLDLFTDMLSSMKEIRAAAIALGLEASFTVGKEKQLSRRVMEILQMAVDETKYIEYYVKELKTMTKDKNDSAAVPQIWSVILLLLRYPVERWEFFGLWLDIIQRCFNSSDFYTKLEANFAWNRLVYVLQLHETSFSKTIGTVCQPFMSQLKRKGSGKQLEELRKIVIGSVCNLYYYAFKPNSSTAQMDSYWDVCARPLLRILVSPEPDAKNTEKHTATSQGYLTQATLILTGLLNSSAPRLWKEDRIAETTLVRPEDLPALDPKWVRRNSPRVFSIVEPILRQTFLDFSDEESDTCKLWRSLVGAVATAASKEVKVSTDTASFLGHALGLLLKIWPTGLSEASDEVDRQQIFLHATEKYLATMIDSLGLLPFTERQLLMNTKQMAFVPVATPSHRSGKGQQGSARAPLHHLFSILSTLPRGISDDEGLSNLIRVTFQPFMLSRSPRARRDLGQELTQTLPADEPHPYGPWVFLSEMISTSLESSQSSYLTTDSGSQPPVGHEYREIVKHLERGIKCTPNLPWDQWLSLFQMLSTRATEEAGEAGYSIAVVEPLAKIVLESFPADDTPVPFNTLKSGIELLSAAKQPRDRQALDAARRRLWGTSVAGSRSPSIDPFDNLYRLTNRLLETSYVQLDRANHAEVVVPLLTEVTGFLVRCSQVLVFKSLVQIQHGLGLWIQDADGRYSSKQCPEVFEAVKNLWDRICGLFVDAALENFELDAIELLLCSAFKSKHRHTVNTVIALWNRAFEHVDEVQYPESLKAVLLSLLPYADIALPGLDVSSYESGGQEPSFIESQDDLGIFNLSSSKKSRRTTPQPSSSRRSGTPASVQPSLPLTRRSRTPNPSRPKSARRSATPRLRHDDSQIQFAPIASSPTKNQVESQVLTERQREVRERQQENSALFPGIRCSAEKDKANAHASHSSPRQSKVTPQQEDAATPKAKHGFENYVSSTPTPRRGQASIVDDDHEMTDDISSSPPEPRRNLLAEMKSRARSNSILEGYPITSSPISGSPTSKQQLANRINHPAEHNDAEAQDITMEQAPSEGAFLPTNKGTEDEPQSSLANPEIVLAQHEPVITKEPTTSPQSGRQPKTQDTPKSDSEVFVDAPTSPIPRTPRVLRNKAAKASNAGQTVAITPQAKDRSFEISDGEERSMARLVVELDSRKCSPLPRYDTASPEKPRVEGAQTLECITVSTQDEERGSSPGMTSSSAEVDDSQSSVRKSRKKRKRSSEKKQDSASKKRRHGKYAAAEDVDAMADSQATTAKGDKPSQMTEGMSVEMDRAMEEMDGPDKATPSKHPRPLPDQRPGLEEVVAPEPSHMDEDSDTDGDTAAVNLQLITEASQQSEAELATKEVVDTALSPSATGAAASGEVVDEDEDEHMEGMVETVPTMAPGEAEGEATAPPPVKSAMETILGSLRNGLEGLRTAELSREQVYKIEDMFMDIKRELYQAEARGRE
ncbi:Uu.00g033300.m01.CDS01 [Anthostomella pinea]|uniref:Uu.00g033300.m01.CDS01 n=1 Tax=Anthostomella pinea TaxID=933095 RepID=A0AAI8YD93_9PEZI|nr:Uu.00g033300.m01.CDS01 [Anthostomella pinea]